MDEDEEIVENQKDMSDSLNFSDINNSGRGEDQGLFLLQRLQQLKVWQARQEALLLAEEKQCDLHLEQVEEDDTTISSIEPDQDVHVAVDPSPTPDKQEDQPLSGGGRTFEQLLAEKLSDKESSLNVEKAITPKPFLKRGSGLARFNLPPDHARQSERTYANKNSAPSGKGNSINNTNGSSKVISRYLSPVKEKKSTVSEKFKPLSSQSPPSILKLKNKGRLSGNVDSRVHSKPVTKFNLCDSIENSFCDKLGQQAKRQAKDLKELEVFKQLEDAANSMSFCSNSSKINSLVTNAILPSPSRNKADISSTVLSFASSTPAPPSMLKSHSTPLENQNSLSGQNSVSKVDSNESSMGESLMEDIRKFLQNKLTIQDPPNASDNRPMVSDETDVDNDSEWTDESDETLANLEDFSNQTIGRDWQERQLIQSKEEEEKENFKPRPPILEFSPPEKLPANPPSQLIWEVFGRERQRQQELAKANLRKKNENESGAFKLKDSSNPGSRSVRFDIKSNPHVPVIRPGISKPKSVPPPLIEKDTNQSLDLSYQSTLLHMRVVELEQEIENFKKENKRIINIKKKLQADKEKLSKELTEFENMKQNEAKKIEEEKRRIKRDRMMLEKGKRNSFKEGCEECNVKSKRVDFLTNDLKNKEAKWTEEVGALKDQLKRCMKEQQELKNENHKLKLKQVASKVNIGKEYMDKEPEVEVNSHNHIASMLAKEDKINSDLVLLDDNSVVLKSNKSSETDPAVPNNVIHEDDVNERRLSDGRLEVWYSNGNRKEVSNDGGSVKIFYYNGDVKETYKDGTVRYLYSHTQTWHTTHPDGKELLQFSSGQEETRHSDGSSRITYPDGSCKSISVGGIETTSFPDGTTVTVQLNGDRVLKLANGQVEEHTSQHRKRTYPDGTVRIVHSDGRQETRYASGRVRVRDSQGVLIQDTGEI